MSQISHESIEPLIQDLQVRGRTVHVLFVCPVSQEKVQARQNVSINLYFSPDNWYKNASNARRIFLEKLDESDVQIGWVHRLKHMAPIEDGLPIEHFCRSQNFPEALLKFF